jgi:DNA-binding LacI/PurR family transcriptional regulator
MDPSPPHAPFTIADVARRAGVGVGTVSRVLNQSPQVRPSTRERVEAAIDELDFRPSAAARSLSLGRTQSVGVVVPLVTSPSAMQRLSGFISVMTKSTYDVVLFDVEQPSRADEHLRRLSHGGGADGVLVVSLRPSDEQVERFVASRTPVVLLDAAHPRLAHVTIDDAEGGRLAAGHLLGLGHRRIAFVGGTEGYVHSSSRRAAWRQTLEAAGVAPGPDLVADFTGPGGAAATRALLELAVPPTAIVYANDVMAIAGMGVAIGLGLEVPGDLSVAGFDDVPLAAHLVPPLTTVRQDVLGWGRAAAGVLLAVSDDQPTADVELPPATPVFRASTGPPRPE